MYECLNLPRMCKVILFNDTDNQKEFFFASLLGIVLLQRRFNCLNSTGPRLIELIKNLGF